MINNYFRYPSHFQFQKTINNLYYFHFEKRKLLNDKQWFSIYLNCWFLVVVTIQETQKTKTTTSITLI